MILGKDRKRVADLEARHMKLLFDYSDLDEMLKRAEGLLAAWTTDGYNASKALRALADIVDPDLRLTRQAHLASTVGGSPGGTGARADASSVSDQTRTPSASTGGEPS